MPGGVHLWRSRLDRLGGLHLGLGFGEGCLCGAGVDALYTRPSWFARGSTVLLCAGEVEPVAEIRRNLSI